MITSAGRGLAPCPAQLGRLQSTAHLPEVAAGVGVLHGEHGARGGQRQISVSSLVCSRHHMIARHWITNTIFTTQVGW